MDIFIALVNLFTAFHYYVCDEPCVLRMEKRHNYVRKVAETATQLFITNDKANCSGTLSSCISSFRAILLCTHHYVSLSVCL